MTDTGKGTEVFACSFVTVCHCLSPFVRSEALPLASPELHGSNQSRMCTSGDASIDVSALTFQAACAEVALPSCPALYNCRYPHSQIPVPDSFPALRLPRCSICPVAKVAAFVRWPTVLLLLYFVNRGNSCPPGRASITPVPGSMVEGVPSA